MTNKFYSGDLKNVADDIIEPMILDFGVSPEVADAMIALADEQSEYNTGGNDLTQAAEYLSKLHSDYSLKEFELKDLKEKIRAMEEDKLPSMMQELQLTEITLNNGWKLKLGEKVTASITEDKRPFAMDWLIKNDFGGLIKTEIKMTFDRGAVEEAIKVAAELREEYPDKEVDAKSTVHPMTLTSFVKEQLGKGAPLPLDIFSVYTINKVELKKGKK